MVLADQRLWKQIQKNSRLKSEAVGLNGAKHTATQLSIKMEDKNLENRYGALPVESRCAGRGRALKRAGGSSFSARGVRSREKEANATDHNQDHQPKKNHLINIEPSIL